MAASGYQVTSRVEFEFSVDESGTPPSGSDLGHLDVLGGEGADSSRDRGPGGAMMICLSVALLLNALVDSSPARSARTARPRSIPRSRSAFTRTGDGSVDTTYWGALVDRSPAKVAERGPATPVPCLPVARQLQAEAGQSVYLTVRDALEGWWLRAGDVIEDALRALGRWRGSDSSGAPAAGRRPFFRSNCRSR